MLGLGGLKKLKNLSVIRSGLGYTVENVSERLGVPRPTLYRYLRDYSIPHTRRGGRISIPDESVERLRRIRDLHGEGLSSEIVRRRVSGGEELESTVMDRRLREISGELEEIKSSLGSGGGSAEAMRVVMARQSLLISAVYNLTEMMEELLAASGRQRGRRSMMDIEEVDRRAREGGEVGRVEVVDEGVPARGSSPERLFEYRARRQARRRRRRAVALGAVLALVAVAWLVWRMLF